MFYNGLTMTFSYTTELCHSYPISVGCLRKLAYRVFDSAFPRVYIIRTSSAYTRISHGEGNSMGEPPLFNVRIPNWHNRRPSKVISVVLATKKNSQWWDRLSTLASFETCGLAGNSTWRAFRMIFSSNMAAWLRLCPNGFLPYRHW